MFDREIAIMTARTVLEHNWTGPSEQAECVVDALLALSPTEPVQEGPGREFLPLVDGEPHCDLLGVDPLCADPPTLIARVTPDDPAIGGQERDGWSTYTSLSEPHSMADCPFGEPVQEGPDYVKRMRELAESVGKRNERIRALRAEPASLELVPHGHDAHDPQSGDLIFCHRSGLASWLIRVGERLRAGDSRWSHVAVVDDWCRGDTEPMLIEALTRGVCRNPLSEYRHTEYAIARTHLSPYDTRQAIAFLRSCLGQHYGWRVIFSIAVRYLTPGRGLDGTKICSGLAAQTMCRGWANYPHQPASMTPSELADYHARGET